MSCILEGEWPVFSFSFKYASSISWKPKPPPTELLMRTDVIRLVTMWISTATEEVQRF